MSTKRANSRPEKPSPKNSSHTSHTTYADISFSENLSDDLREFWRKLFICGNRQENNGAPIINLNDRSEIERWLKCWSAGCTGLFDCNALQVLVKCLLILPAANKLLPAHEQVLKILVQITRNVASTCDTGSKQSVHSCYSQLDLVVRVVRLRLLDSVQFLRETSEILRETDELIETYNQSVMALGVIFPRDHRITGELREKARVLLRYYHAVLETTHRLQRGDAVAAEADASPWLGWRDKPTVGWLMSGSWHDVLPLKRKYNSQEEYAETLLRMWTMLSFYWGSGALWPTCKYKRGGASNGGGDRICGEPLLQRGSRSQCYNAGCGPYCGKSASWSCGKKGHDGTCGSCLSLAQNLLCGSPGPWASTDVYDGLVAGESIRREGVLLLVSQLLSRKPPKVSPNWKTSYRLPVSGFIAVVKLGSSRCALTRDMPVLWAEVVPYDPNNKREADWEFRAKGLMALRIITRADCPSMPARLDTSIDLGTRIAIIDMRVFVPEVLSVLSTFASQSTFLTHLSLVPFVDRLIGKPLPSNSPHAISQKKALKTLTRLFAYSSPSLEQVVRDSIINSEIELLQSKTLGDNLREQIIQKICDIQQIRLLYGTQLIAFASGLCLATHCTQGPPGTGKV